MSWLSIIWTTIYFLLWPLITLLNWLLLALAPVLHLGNYIVSGALLPFKLLARFETLYIYLGVAAVIGLLTGSILHLSSSVLVSVFKLAPVPAETGRSAASVRAARERKKLEAAWQFSPSKDEQGEWRADATMGKYSEWLEKDLGKRREDQGLLGQTIIEEDDDSEDVF